MDDREKRTENSFMYTLNRLLKTMVSYVDTSVSDPQEVIQRLKSYAALPDYITWCEELALNMTTQVNRGVSATWRKAAQKAGRGSEIYSAIIQELKTPHGGAFFQTVRQNAELIKTFPLGVSQDLTEYISREAIQGRRSGDILTDLKKKFPDTAKSRLRLIARTEVSKTQSALTQARASSLGLNWYIWRTSEDSRVRSAHGHMEGVLVKYSDPPSPEELFPRKDVKPYGKYNAGETFNCRCYAEVIVNLDYVDFPAKVFHGATVERMSRSHFENIM